MFLECPKGFVALASSRAQSIVKPYNHGPAPTAITLSVVSQSH